MPCAGSTAGTGSSLGIHEGSERLGTLLVRQACSACAGLGIFYSETEAGSQQRAAKE